MGSIVLPVGVIINIEFSLSIFDDSVGVVYTASESDEDRASSVCGVEVMKSLVDVMRELEDIS